MSESTLSSLLFRWKTAFRQGQDIPAPELCKDRPDLLPEIERCLRTLRDSFSGGCLRWAGEGISAPLSTAPCAKISARRIAVGQAHTQQIDGSGGVIVSRSVWTDESSLQRLTESPAVFKRRENDGRRKVI